MVGEWRNDADGATDGPGLLAQSDATTAASLVDSTCALNSPHVEFTENSAWDDVELDVLQSFLEGNEYVQATDDMSGSLDVEDIREFLVDPPEEHDAYGQSAL